jgi:hypothetical protein
MGGKAVGDDGTRGGTKTQQAQQRRAWARYCRRTAGGDDGLRGVEGAVAASPGVLLCYGNGMAWHGPTLGRNAPV